MFDIPLYMLVLPVVIIAIIWWYTRVPSIEIDTTGTPQETGLAFEPVAIDTLATTIATPTKKLEGPPMKILFGSQTGTAEDFSQTLCEEATAHGFGAEVIDIEEYDPEELADEQYVVFMVATYGEGEPTDNAKEFYDWLMDEEKDKNTDLCRNVKYSVFGLGNSTYEHFNAMARIFEKRMNHLGATIVHTRGEGDDDSSLEEDFDKWKTELWGPACSLFGLSAEAKHVDRKALYKLKEHPSDTKWDRNAITWQKGKIDKSVVDSKNPVYCEIIEKRELHSEKSDRSCMHVEIKLPEKLTYEPGDHVGIFAPNDSDVVEQTAKVLKVDLDKIISLHPIDNEAKVVVGPCTIRHALTHFVELTQIPRKSTLLILAQYTTDEEEKAKLIHYTTPEGADDYNEYVKNSHRILYEILADFPSCAVPFAHFMELLTALNPRFYSISSSIKQYPGAVHATAVLVEYDTPTKRHHKGVCTTHLTTKKVNDKLPVFIRRSVFKLPMNPATPILLVGPGTGIAPFRGFIQERRHLNNIGKCYLFFGCRNREIDYIYKDELEAAEKEGTITKLITAFSREQEHKIYVQDKILEHSHLVWEVLNSANGTVYICGDAKAMARDVLTAFRKVCVKEGKMSEPDAERFMSALTTASTPSRYQTDVWS